MSYFTMSHRMPAILLKQFNKTANIPSISLMCRYLSFSATSVKHVQNQNEVVQIAKHLQPLMKRSVKDILADVDVDMSGVETVTFLKALRLHTVFNKVPPENFKNDTMFHQLCDIFQQKCSSLEHSLLVSGLRSLLEVGLPATSACVVSAETETLRSVQKFNVFTLIRCLHFHHRFVNSDLQIKVVASLFEEVVNKLPDVCTPSEVLFLSQIYHLFDEAHQKKVEQKLVELVSLLNAHEMCKVICSLAQSSTRNVLILNAISFHMRLKLEYPQVKEMVNILYAFKKLNYIDTKLFSYLLNKAVQEIPQIKQPSLISGFLTTCGHLKWKHSGLLDACTDWIKENFESCRTREFTAFVLSIAALNYSTQRTKSLLESILPHLTIKEVKSTDVLLDVAWSLAILNNIPKDLLLNILSPEFYKSLLDDQDFQTKATNKLKLMNLKGVLKVKHPECIFGCDMYLEPIKLKESSDVEQSRNHVIKVLSNFVPKNKYLCESQINDMGIFIDAEFIMDNNVKPLSLAEYGVSTRSSKTLPKGAKRIALLVMFHKDYTQNARTLTGVNALAAKLLSHSGYSVVHISFDEFLRNKTEVQKAKHLLQNITPLVQNGGNT